MLSADFILAEASVKMAKRTILVQNPCKLSIGHNQLVIDGEKKAKIPLSEIWVVILESNRAIVTVAALSSLAEAGIGVLVCGRDHMPNSLSLPLGAHSRHAAIVENQLLMSKPLKNRLWQALVKRKIENQSQVAALLGQDNAKLLEYAAAVQSADKTGREAVAAAEYFRSVLPFGTRREGPYAAALDFGYAVLRAGIARTLVSGGWLVSRGIHHSNDLNAFNLADDLIEPFRPFVDLLVVGNGVVSPLNADRKAELAGVFEEQAVVNGSSMLLQTAIEETIDSFKRSVVERDAALLELPEIPQRTAA